VSRIGYSSPRCPQDAAHGPLMAWPSSVAGWYCPHQAHDGNPFYRTDLTPATPRSASDGSTDDRSTRTRRKPTEAPRMAASPRNTPPLVPPGGGVSGFWE
jgi:hypothetical protein